VCSPFLRLFFLISYFSTESLVRNDGSSLPSPLARPYHATPPFYSSRLCLGEHLRHFLTFPPCGRHLPCLGSFIVCSFFSILLWLPVLWPSDHSVWPLLAPSVPPLYTVRPISPREPPHPPPSLFAHLPLTILASLFRSLLLIFYGVLLFLPANLFAPTHCPLTGADFVQHRTFRSNFPDVIPPPLLPSFDLPLPDFTKISSRRC